MQVRKRTVIGSCGGVVEHKGGSIGANQSAVTRGLITDTPDLGFRAGRGIDSPPGLPLPSAPHYQGFFRDNQQDTSHNPKCHYTVLPRIADFMAEVRTSQPQPQPYDKRQLPPDKRSENLKTSAIRGIGPRH